MIDERVIPGKTDPVNLMKHIARYNMALAVCQGKKVLDLACGTGYGSYILSLVSKYVFGVDISYESIESAKFNFRRDNLLYIWDDINNLNADNKMNTDVIVSFETIEHIEDLSKLEAVYDNLLSDKGMVIYSVPLNEPENLNPYHKHRFTVERGINLFPSYKLIDSYIQTGVNFYKTDSGVPQDKPFTYLLCYKQKIL